MAEVFEYAVAYVEDLRNFDHQLARVVGGVKAVAVKLYDGGKAHRENLDLLASGRMRELRSAGYSVGSWAVPRTAPEQAAADCSSLYVELGLSFQVFECEWEYKRDGGGIDVDRLLAPWRARRPFAYTAVATEGMVPREFNHRAAQRWSCRYLPESYWGIDARYDASAEFHAARALGWNLAHVHPTLTGVGERGGDGLDRRRDTMAEAIVRAYRARAAGFTRGVAIWRGDMLTRDDYRLLGIVAGDLYRAV
jgi:hypothetical protein